MLLGERLLPVRESRALPPDLSRHARTLVEQFRLDARACTSCGCARARRWSGRRAAALDLADRGADARHRARRRTGEVRLGDDRRGRRAAGARRSPRRSRRWRSTSTSRCATRPTPGRSRTTLFNRASGLAEVLIPPRSPLIGDRLFPGHGDAERRPRGAGGAAAGRRPRRAASRWRPATRCCCRAPGRRSTSGWRRAEVLVVNSPDLVRRQALPMGPGAVPTLAGAGGDGRAARDRDRAGGDRRAARRGRGAAARGAVGRRDLPGDQLDDGDPGRRDDAAVDRDHRDRRGASCSPTG